MTHRVGTQGLAWALVLALLSAPLPALAQSDEQRAAARELATEGARAFQEGKYDQAVELFGRAESLYHALPHLLFMARAHAKLGHFVKARETYLKIQREALPPNAPQAARDAQSNAANEIGGVEAQIGRLTVTVEGREQARDLVVSVNGAPIAAVLVGVPQPIDPGEHKVEAVATGFRASPQTVTVAPGARVPVVLKLEADAAAVAPTPVPPPGATEPAPTPAAQPTALPPPDVSGPPTSDSGTGGGTNGLRIGSYVAFGVGAVGLGLGTVFLVQSAGSRSDADDLCTLPNGACDRRLQSQVDALDDDADSQATLGVVGLAVGGVGLAAGVTLLILSSQQAKTASVVPWIGPNSAGIAGRF